MNSLSMLIEKMVSDDRAIVVVGKDKNGKIKTLFKGTVLDAWKHRKTDLDRYMYRDVIDIIPATIHLTDDQKVAGLKVIIYCEYGFRD